ncbi:purine-cytosine permease family protein [Sodalis sp. C49]|uniref:purine-cytosine permease family protein n=1 Tax=Sodalis sp. C49 TaxID=3228929 RepID=UPI003965C839
MEKINIAANDYACARVPDARRSGFLTVTMIRIGITTTLGQFLLGAMLGHAMTFYQALFATFLGSLILEFVGLGLGLAAAREGLSTSLLARWCGFGQAGSVLIGVVIALSLLGWFGVQNAIFAHGVDYMLGGRLGFGCSAVITGMALTALVACGFRALGWTAMISVPLFFLVVGWIALELLAGHDVAALVAAAPIGEPMTLGMAATSVAGGCIVGAVTTADISRYCKNGRHVFWMITVSIIIGEFVVNGIAILIAHALGTSDVVAVMTQTAGWVGVSAVILSAVKINDANLYSSSLALANAFEGITGRKLSYRRLTIILGACGTILTLIGILEQYQHFLILMGVVFPPVAGVMVCDYYLLRTSRRLLDQTRANYALPDPALTPVIGWRAVIACVTGILAGLLFDAGIAALNSLMVSIIVYWIICTLKSRRVADVQ